jgi:hypothetical protein
MATSPLDPNNLNQRPDRILGSGHGVRSLGPSDSSDSGSDMSGSGDTDDELDSDSDRSGTGERAAAEGEVEVRDGADIDTDRVESIPSEEEPDKSRK